MHPSFFPHLMAPRHKHLCGCGCTLYVTRDIELGHLNGRRSAVLAANTLSQNRSLLCNRKQASKLQLMSSSRHSWKGELIGRRAPVRQEFLSRKASRPDKLLSKNPSGETGDEYSDFPASEAGPSGVSPHTFDIDMTLSAQHSPTHETQDLPHTVDLDMTLSAQHSPTLETQDPPPPPRSSPMVLPVTDGRDQSSQRRSHRIAERVKQIGQVRWGTNHVRLIEREEREKDDEEAGIEGDVEDEEDGMGHDVDELEDEDMPFAEPGQEGISVWDLLGDGFLKEVADLGSYF